MDYSSTSQGGQKGAFKSYVIGFLLSVFFTLFAYVLVDRHMLKGLALFGSLTGLAIAQMCTQLICFLFLNKESRPRLHLIMFIFSVIVVFILVTCSLWIMYHLNYRMMPGMES